MHQKKKLDNQKKWHANLTDPRAPPCSGSSSVDVVEGEHGMRHGIHARPRHAACRGGGRGGRGGGGGGAAVLVLSQLAPRLQQLHAAPGAGDVAPQAGSVEGHDGPERDAGPRQVARQRQREVERPQQEREPERLQEPGRHGRHGEA